MSPTKFNVIECIFWLTLSGALFFAYSRAPRKFKKWVMFSGVNTLLFGVSDGVEVYTGGFLHTAQRPLLWKLINVLGLVMSIVWYFYLRLK